MIKLIVGTKGTGKTKTLIDMARKAAEESKGNVVCVEKGDKLAHELPNAVRLVNSEEYDIRGFANLYGFLAGFLAGNYDITHIFIDSLTKIVGGECDNETEKFLDWLNNFGEQHNIKFTITISDDESLAPEGVKKYF